MKRLALLLLVVGILVPTGLALYAQDAGQDSAEQQLDQVIRSLRAALAEAAAKGPTKPITFELRMYDVRALVTPIQDYPAGSINLVPSGGFGFGYGEAEDLEPLAFYEIDAIIDMIRQNVAPDSWDELRSASIQQARGILMVRHMSAVHDRIEMLLGELRKKAASQVNVEVKVLRLPDAALRAIQGGEGAAVLTPAGEKRLRAVVASGEAKVIRTGSVACTNSQRVSLSDTGRVSYVQDFDVEIAQAAFIGDPIVTSLSEGLIFDVRPTLAGYGDLVVLEVRVENARLNRPMPSVETPVGTIETPRLELTKLRTILAVPVGRTVVVGGALADGDDEAVLIVVTPTANRPGRR